MEFSSQEIEKIETAIRVKMSQRMFTYKKVNISCDGKKLILQFTDVRHQYFRNVRMITYQSYIQDTTMFVYVFVRLRFLHGNAKSPVIGIRLSNFRIILQ